MRENCGVDIKNTVREVVRKHSESQQEMRVYTSMHANLHGSLFDMNKADGRKWK